MFEGPEKEGVVNVEGESTDPAFDISKEEKRPPENIEELEEYLRQGQSTIDAYRRYFQTFAEDISVSFKLGNAFFINMKTGEVSTDVSWFWQRGYSMNQILWAHLHELSHFVEATDDPEGVTNNFDYLREKAREISPLVVKKLRDTFGDKYEKEIDRVEKKRPVKGGDGEEMSGADQMVYKIYHRLYNSLADVYVNSFVARRAGMFSGEARGAEEVINLYREKLFKEGDYKGTPRHTQFAQKILRDEMIPEESAEVDDEVAEIFEREIEFDGETYTIKELLNKFFKAKSGENNNISKRLEVMKEVFVPIFENLLIKDLEEWEPPDPEEQGGGDGEDSDDGDGEGSDSGDGEKSKKKKDGSKDGQDSSSGDDKNKDGDGGKQESGGSNEDKEDGSDNNDEQGGSGNGDDQSGESEENNPTESGNGAGKGKEEGEFDKFRPFRKEYEDYEANDPSQINEEEIKDYADKVREEIENKDENEDDPDERERKMKERLDRNWCEENDIDYESTFLEYERVRESILPYLDQMSELWRNIVYGKSSERQRSVEGHFKTGSELDIAKTVEEWPDVARGKFDQTRLMKRDVLTETPILKPELIRFRVLGDMSGSMTDNPNKLPVLRQAIVLILESLREFNDFLNISRRHTKSKMKVDTEAWTFNMTAEKIKKFRDDMSGDDRADMLRIFNHLLYAEGGTNDAQALEMINYSLSKQEIERIKSGKLMEIVFEITDGVSSLPEKTSEYIEKLSKKGVIVRGFQIGVVEQEEAVSYGRTGREGYKQRIIDSDEVRRRRIRRIERQRFESVWNSGKVKRGESIPGGVENLLPAIVRAMGEYFENIKV